MRELNEPVACSLNGTDLKSQQERWINLGESFGVARTATDDGVRLAFRFDPEVQKELHALVAAENDCCAWASWTVDRDAAGDLVMTVRSTGDGVATLHGMFADPRFEA